MNLKHSHPLTVLRHLQRNVSHAPWIGSEVTLIDIRENFDVSRDDLELIAIAPDLLEEYIAGQERIAELEATVEGLLRYADTLERAA